MKKGLYSDRQVPNAARWVLLLVAVATIFVADTVTDFEIAVAVFYVAAVLVADGFLRTKGVIATSAACMGLTVASLLLTRDGAYEPGLVNALLSIGAIGVTAYLALRRSSAIIAEHETRDQLTRIARVSALGELATSIAHEVNQPLTAIIASGGACRNWLSAAPPNIEKAELAVERMVADATRASDVVARVRALSKRAEPKREWIDAEALVSNALLLCRDELDRAAILVVRNEASGQRVVFADEIHIQQVLLNMILNALEAMSADAAEEHLLSIGTVMGDDQSVAFTIADTGRGIEAEKAEKIFDAFYSGKVDGIGMGLAISRSIIEAHGGRIEVASRPGGGAEFRFTLPGRASEGQ